MLPKRIEDWLVQHTPPCKEVTQTISESMDRPIGLRRRIMVRLHFLICKWCLRYQQQLKFIRKTLRRDPQNLEQNATLSPEARERMKSSLNPKDH
jgi:hypothetical protein